MGPNRPGYGKQPFMRESPANSASRFRPCSNISKPVLPPGIETLSRNRLSEDRRRPRRHVCRQGATASCGERPWIIGYHDTEKITDLYRPAQDHRGENNRPNVTGMRLAHGD